MNALLGEDFSPGFALLAKRASLSETEEITAWVQLDPKSFQDQRVYLSVCLTCIPERESAARSRWASAWSERSADWRWTTCQSWWLSLLGTDWNRRFIVKLSAANTQQLHCKRVLVLPWHLNCEGELYDSLDIWINHSRSYSSSKFGSLTETIIYQCFIMKKVSALYSTLLRQYIHMILNNINIFTKYIN